MRTSCVIIIFLISHTLILAQSDWEIINTNITEHLHDIEFINDSVGYMYSYGTGSIYQSKDEGYTWTIIKQTDSIYFEQIQFVNSDLGWICGEQGKILKTYDGGKTWSDMSIIVKDKNLLLYGMCFINDTIGYVSGAEMGSGKLIPKTYRTLNGGISWKGIYDDIPGMILNLTKKENDLFASGNGFIIKINTVSHIWEYVFKDTSAIIGQIRDLRFASDQFGVATSFKGKILISNNRGNSFTYKEITRNRLRSIAYLGEKRWMVVGDNNKNEDAVIHISNDNGESWEKVSDFPDIHRIHLTKKTIWIVGKNGFIAKSKQY
ncbi:YCF48-related protein [Bacteroidota bacterium]